MTAKDMFKELNFKWKETEDVIEYTRSLFKHFSFFQKEKITFHKDSYNCYFYLDGVNTMNIDLLQAINQQVYELGWENVNITD